MPVSRFLSFPVPSQSCLFSPTQVLLFLIKRQEEKEKGRKRRKKEKEDVEGGKRICVFARRRRERENMPAAAERRRKIGRGKRNVFRRLARRLRVNTEIVPVERLGERRGEEAGVILSFQLPERIWIIVIMMMIKPAFLFSISPFRLTHSLTHSLFPCAASRVHFSCLTCIRFSLFSSRHVIPRSHAHVPLPCSGSGQLTHRLVMLARPHAR